MYPAGWHLKGGTWLANSAQNRNVQNALSLESIYVFLLEGIGHADDIAGPQVLSSTGRITQ